jgi:hypothetical protein
MPHQDRTMDQSSRDRPAQVDRAGISRDPLERERRRRERAQKRKQALDERLDLGLEDSFPASDPVAVTQPPASTHDKRAS